MSHEKELDERSTSGDRNDLHRRSKPKGVSDATGEDEGSTAKEGNEDHLKPDQKTTSR